MGSLILTAAEEWTIIALGFAAITATIGGVLMVLTTIVYAALWLAGLL